MILTSRTILMGWIILTSWITLTCWTILTGCIILREVVNNFQEYGDRSKNSTFFLFTPKDPFGDLFSKIILKISSEFLFWQKIRKFEIGQNVPNLHNFYLAFSAFSQRSHKTTKIYLGLTFLNVVFHPLE